MPHSNELHEAPATTRYSVAEGEASLPTVDPAEAVINDADSTQTHVEITGNSFESTVPVHIRRGLGEVTIKVTPAEGPNGELELLTAEGEDLLDEAA